MNFACETSDRSRLPKSFVVVFDVVVDVFRSFVCDSHAIYRTSAEAAMSYCFTCCVMF